jgi:hypothetical protein
MDKTVAMVEYLQDWQNMSYEEVESASDIKVFNVIGTLIQLVKNDYLKIYDVFDFIGLLNLTEEENQKITKIVNNAYESATIIN